MRPTLVPIPFFLIYSQQQRHFSNMWDGISMDTYLIYLSISNVELTNGPGIVTKNTLFSFPDTSTIIEGLPPLCNKSRTHKSETLLLKTRRVKVDETYFPKLQ